MATSTWIAQVTNSTLNITLSTFSFQDALNPSGRDIYGSYSNPPFLFRNGCLQDNGTQDCTASCQDSHQVFGSLDTLHNCMVYPTVADLYARSNLSDASLPGQYNIQKSKVNATVSHNVTVTIQNCLLDYCNENLNKSGCPAGLESTDLKSSPSNLTSTYYIYDDTAYDRFDFCVYVPKSFNPDIGGIGVYVSYWIQTGLALLSFVLVVWWNWAIYYVCLGALLWPRGYSKARRIAQKIRNNARNKHLPSLTGGLAEFQKAQCFFMLAINIAALVNRNSGGFQPNSMQQLYDTYVLIKSISISGYLPVTFTLFTLHLVDVVSWYLLVLSVLTVLVSIATLFVIGNFSPSQDDLNYLSQQALTGGPDSCGGTNLGVYCYSPNGSVDDSSSADPSSGAYSMLAFCLVVLILLVAHQCHAFKDVSTGRPKPWLYKLSLRNLRIIQTGLAVISLGLNSYAVGSNLGANAYEELSYWEKSESVTLRASQFVLFASCWTLSFILYLSLTSATDYTRTDRSIGRFYNRKIAFAAEFLSTVFWFAALIALARFYPMGPCGSEGADVCGPAITSILVAVFTWITFLVTTFLAARHLLRTPNELSEKHRHGKQHWIFQRFSNHRLTRQLSDHVPSWKRLTRKVPSWKETSRKLPSWTKHPRIITSYTKLQQNTLPTMKVHIQRAYRVVETNASTLDWPSTMASAAIFSLYVLFVGLYIHWFKIFIQDLEWFAYNGVDKNSWSFGQVVAISVWAEPLCEYFHLGLRGMKRGFEHRLWGYKVVKIKQPDAERGLASDATSSDHHSPSPSASLDDRRSSEYGIVDHSADGDGDLAARDGDGYHREKGAYSSIRPAESTVRPVPESGSGEGSEETETETEAGERGIVEGWQIPETVILTSGAIGPF